MGNFCVIQFEWQRMFALTHFNEYCMYCFFVFVMCVRTVDKSSCVSFPLLRFFRGGGNARVLVSAFGVMHF